MSGDLRSGARQWGGRLPLAEACELTGQQQELADQLHTFAVPWAERAGFVGTTQRVTSSALGTHRCTARARRPGSTDGSLPTSRARRSRLGFVRSLS
jgi:hypothetical protein